MHPSSLNNGDTYRYVFVTSTTRDASSTNIADYDAHVNAAIDAADPTGLGAIDWRVWGSTPFVNAFDHLFTPSVGWDHSDVPIFRINTDTIIASGVGDLTDGTLINPISVTESGTPPSKEVVFTGSFVPGGIGALALGTTSFFVTVGNLNESRAPWSFDGIRSPYEHYHFYAFSDVITVSSGASVPEPSSMPLELLGLAGIGAYHIRRRRQNA